MEWIKQNLFVLILVIVLIILGLIAFQKWTNLKEADTRKAETLARHETLLQENMYKMGLMEGLIINYQTQIKQYEDKKQQIKNNITVQKKKYESLPPTEQDKFFVEKFLKSTP